jgi:hypothetical protein
VSGPRLPEPGSDSGNWGNILNEFLRVGHNDNGTVKDIAAIQSQLNSISQEVFEVFLQLDYSVDPATFDVVAHNLYDGFHVLVTWSLNSEMRRGIYVVQDGALMLSTAIFDGSHNGAVIWAYRKITQDDGDLTGPYLYGVYTTEFCSLVELSGPSAAVTAANVSYDNTSTGIPARFVNSNAHGYDFSANPMSFSIRINGSNDYSVYFDLYTAEGASLVDSFQSQIGEVAVSYDSGNHDIVTIQTNATGNGSSIEIFDANQVATDYGFGNGIVYGANASNHVASLPATSTVQAAINEVADTAAAATTALATKVTTTDVRLRNMQLYSFASDFSFSIEHAEAVVETAGGGPVTAIVPHSSVVNFPIGTKIDICQMSSSQTTISTDESVGLFIPVGFNQTIESQYGTVTIRKRATDEWVLSGALSRNPI